MGDKYLYSSHSQNDLHLLDRLSFEPLYEALVEMVMFITVVLWQVHLDLVGC